MGCSFCSSAPQQFSFSDASSIPLGIRLSSTFPKHVIHIRENSVAERAGIPLDGILVAINKKALSADMPSTIIEELGQRPLHITIWPPAYTKRLLQAGREFHSDRPDYGERDLLPPFPRE